MEDLGGLGSKKVGAVRSGAAVLRLDCVRHRHDRDDGRAVLRSEKESLQKSLLQIELKELKKKLELPFLLELVLQKLLQNLVVI